MAPQSAPHVLIADDDVAELLLFRRILRDADFQAGKLDTGFLERLLAKPAAHPTDHERAAIAAIAAGLFHVLDPAHKNGKSSEAEPSSQWKHNARSEALREN